MTIFTATRALRFLRNYANALSSGILVQLATACCFSVAQSSNGASTTVTPEVTTRAALCTTVKLAGQEERARANVF